MIVIVGAGALGSHVALALRHETLRVIDFDRVEQKNTLSQFHGVQGLGKNKAHALTQSLFGLFRVKSTAIPHKLTTENVHTLLDGANLVIDCTDNAEARHLLQRTCIPAGLPLLHGALAEAGMNFGRAVWASAFTPDEGGEGKPTCEDGAQLPFIQLVSALVAKTAQHYLLTGEQISTQVSGLSFTRIA